MIGLNTGFYTHEMRAQGKKMFRASIYIFIYQKKKGNMLSNIC